LIGAPNLVQRKQAYIRAGNDRNEGGNAGEGVGLRKRGKLLDFLLNIALN